VDVIVSGDSHTLLGDGLDVYGFAPRGSYPTVLANADGEPVYLVQAWEYAKALGVLDVTFEGDVIVAASGRTCLPVSGPMLRDSGKKDDKGAPLLEEMSPSGIEGVKAALAGTSLVYTEADPAVAAIARKYRDMKGDAELEVIATVAEDLGHNRIPGDGRDGYSLPLGSDIAPLVAKAFYELDPAGDLCIQNGGGVRVSIAKGELTLKRSYELLPFANSMYEIKMTGAEIVQVMEDALLSALDNHSTGSFPYAYGIRYDVDASKPAYSRMGNVEIRDRKTGAWGPMDMKKIYVVITNNYTGGGKDGYVTFKTVQDERGPGYDTMTDYALSFIQYARKLNAEGKALTRLSDGERCMKSYIAP